MMPLPSLDNYKWWQNLALLVVIYIEALSFGKIDIELPDCFETPEFLSWRNNLLSLCAHAKAVMSVPEDIQ